MSRFIDAEVFAERLLNAWTTADEEKRAEIVAILANIVTPILVGTPTADVAPRAEVEKLHEVIFKKEDLMQKIAEERNKYADELEVVKDTNEHLKSEVATKIFAEIEKIRLKEIHKCETLREKESDPSERKYWEGGYNSLRQLSYWIAELKKKYTEGQK